MKIIKKDNIAVTAKHVSVIHLTPANGKWFVRIYMEGARGHLPIEFESKEKATEFYDNCVTIIEET